MAPQDTYTEEEDEVCPLCIEEFDLQDKFFKPCPCGYQICQFCFNNIRTNMNGLCPACRRPYDEKTIVWRAPTSEESAEYEARKAMNNKKRTIDQRQKEFQVKKEPEKESRKNLVGVRVVQKNLVYVTGLTPTVREDELLKTLRKPEFFGQYGPIQKISISNRKSTDGHNNSLGIYVTFEKKEDAAKCIQAVNGSLNGDRTLRAQLGTTKYCSAWLRYEQCNNRQCMFLHELGDEEDSYTRQDLSSLNSINSQGRISGNASSSRSGSRPQVHPQPAHHSALPPSAPVVVSTTPAAAQPMARTASKDGSENEDGSALPSTANWARNPTIRSRRGSQATSGAAPSPALSASLPATAESVQEHTPSPVEDVASGPLTADIEFPEPVELANKDLLTEISKSAGGWQLPIPSLPDGQQLNADAYPPLFDPQGGEKRRALRDEDDAHLGLGQDDLADTQQSSEGEPETGGSRALGGEPEDREPVRDSHDFDMRRGSQASTQRSSNEGLFGHALHSALSSVTPSNTVLNSLAGSRTLTPQQQNMMRSQGAFVDHLPPSISSQANFFQSQVHSHNRQGSRFSFANQSRDNPTTTVKLSGNPRIMAQQSSMMPSGFHGQPGGQQQYYASSISGPPPGLKSTGTPPNLFGQHGFLSTFGAMSKDSNEILSMLNRGRGAGAQQTHEAGKREYMISSFSNQYPPSTSSTPAPAPNLLASLYGPSPGAFQDLGSRQKKKGKRHRHANTSSSGGSGLVDLADSSILQARLQHQQQSNAGVGQGLFGGQSQEDDLGPLDDALFNVDDLVSDESIDMDLSRPHGVISSMMSPLTPLVPPGLGFPQSASAMLSPVMSHPSLPGASRVRRTPAAISILPSTSITESPLLNAVTRVPTGPAGADAKKSIKAMAVESGLSKDIASHFFKTKGKWTTKSVLQEEDFPALDTPKSTASVPKTPVVLLEPLVPKAASVVTKIAEKTVNKGAEKPASKPLQRAQDIKMAEKSAAETPSPATARTGRGANKKPVLNIAAAAKAALTKKAESSFSSIPTSTATTVTSTTTPSTTATDKSPLDHRDVLPLRTAPKTLRVVTTPKVEVPPSSTALSAGGGSVAGSSFRTAASLVAAGPETPASEVISDSASILSASVPVSRTSSPQPALSVKVGTAHIRLTTKSQQRKHRKEASRKGVASLTPMVELGPEIAPIMGRKKKQKKEKESVVRCSSHSATPTVSLPGTPPLAQPCVPNLLKDSSKEAKDGRDTKQAVKETKEESSTYRSTANETTSLTDDKFPQKLFANITGKSLEGGRTLNTLSSDAVPAQPTPAAVLAQLQEEGELPARLDELFLVKPVSSQADKQRREADGAIVHGWLASQNAGSGAVPITAEEHATLLAGHVVRKTVAGVPLLVTPSFNWVRCLSPEEEDLYLKYQDRVSKSAIGPAAFSASRPDDSGNIRLVKDRAVPAETPSYFPQLPGRPAINPYWKYQQEDVLYFMNQYVLPNPNLDKNKIALSTAYKAALASLSSLASRADSFSVSPWYLGQDVVPDNMDISDTAAPELSFSGSVDDFAVLDTFTPPENHGTPAPLFGAGHLAFCPPDNYPILPLEDTERALSATRRDGERLEKNLNQLIRKNRRLLALSLADVS